jgi:zinc transport system ATP-binding protein
VHVSAVVDVRGVHVAYDGRPALLDVDFAVTPGEVVAILGANGSGKSTLVRSLLGLVPLSAGEVRLFGTPLREFRDWPRIGYVPQRVGAATGVPATVREVVTSGRLPRMRRLRGASAADRAAVERALEVVQLADRADASVATLSGGQQQRVLIARALTCGPELLVLDEPTSGVDLASQSALADALRLLVDEGVTVLNVAHELGPMHALVSRAVTLADGRVLHDGPPPALDHLHLHDPEHAHPPHEVHADGVRTPSPWGLR